MDQDKEHTIYTTRLEKFANGSKRTGKIATGIIAAYVSLQAILYYAEIDQIKYETSCDFPFDVERKIEKTVKAYDREPFCIKILNYGATLARKSALEDAKYKSSWLEKQIQQEQEEISRRQKR
jgi:hypothetical protein